MSLTGLKDVDREVLKNIDDRLLLKICAIDRKTWNSVCDDDFLRRRLTTKYPGIEKYKNENETWKRFFLRAIYYIAKMKEKYEYDYTYGDFKEQYYMLKDYKGDSLLFVAAARGNLNIARHAIQNGAHVNARGGLPMKTAIEKGNLDLVKYLMQNGANVNIEEVTIAVRKGILNIVKYLAENGADIHAMHDDALVIASIYGFLDIVKYLVEKGANIHTWGESSLIQAARYGHLPTVMFLVEQGADVHANEDKAIYEARVHGHRDVENYLHSI